MALLFGLGLGCGAQTINFDDVDAATQPDSSGESGRSDSADAQRVACYDDMDCALPLKRCDTATGECVACRTDYDCGYGQTCEPTAHLCVFECNTAADCPAFQPTCSETRGVCICTSDQTCMNSSRVGGACDPSTGQCVECLSYLQCRRQQVCDTSRDICVGCLTDINCPVGEFCDAKTDTCWGSGTPDAGADSPQHL